MEGKTGLKQIYQQCLYGKISLADAVEALDRELGGITAAFYTPQKFTLQNHSRREPFDTRDQGRKFVRARQQLAILCYQRAQKNGSMQPGEIHISRQASTKDHKQGLTRILR
ncbi:MAG TPA: hypothetical protein VJH95_05075 [Candidatus Nanoarchaeia archaeon]|nr:hypothetical protein [Candidatus Nanoarchaeia archaeon]